ncbi:SART-1 family protein DOT2 [Quillaja saponaria]|uniref:SART-1 family protein DOT2 n=1 Tax=Quillaja saponaria TaxID=32244 RepID=A0AAD7QEH3_QUISA|nr:SART-1 family protein DOT2 [Quillaja saponaria]
MELAESRFDRDECPMREQYDDLEQVGTEKSSKHRSKDRKRSSRGEDKEDRSKDKEHSKRDISKEREKEARDSEKDRVYRRERKKEDTDEHEKERSKDSKAREKDYDREKYREKEREKDKDRKNRGKEKDHERERETEKDSDRGRDKERVKEKSRDRDREREKERDKINEKEREKHRDREKERENYRDKDKEKGKERIREKERDVDQDIERSRDRDKTNRKSHEEDYGWSKDENHKVDYHEKRAGEVSKQGKASQDSENEPNGESSAHPSASELEGRILKMKEARLNKQSEGVSEALAWVGRSRKIEEKKNAGKAKALKRSKIFEEQDNIGQEESEDEDATKHTSHNLEGVKVLHGLDRVMEGGAVVLTLKDQNILADGDINEEVDMLENVEIGEQKRRSEAYQASKKKTGIYDDKFNDDLVSEKKILPQYNDPATDEGFILDERGKFSGEAEKKLEELRRRLQGVSTHNQFEDLNTSGNFSSDYYTHEEMLQFKKPKKKKSLRKKEKLDIDSLEAEARSAGLGVADLGSRNDAKKQAIKEEQARFEAEKRNSAYQSAYSKADEASKLLRLEQTLPVKLEEDEIPVFADDDEDLNKSLERARRIALKKKEEEAASGPQAIALLATNPNSQTAHIQNPTTGESQENKVVFTEMEEFVWGLQIDEEARKPESGDVFMQEDEEAKPLDEGETDEAGGWTEIQENSEDEHSAREDKEEIVPDEIIHEVTVGKGLSGVLKLLKERGTLKESVEWGGRNMDKKKSKLVGILDGDEPKDTRSSSLVDNKKEILLERRDEFGRLMTPKEAFRMISHKFHGKGPGKMKQEKRLKQFLQESKLKQMKSSDTPSLSVERMREAQESSKTPYLVLSGHVKPGQTSDPQSGFATVEKDVQGGLTPMLGDRKVEHFLGIKRKAESLNSSTSKKPKS